MYLTRRDLYYPLLSLLITNTMSFTLRWNTRRKGEIYRGSKWRVDRRFDPLPLPLPMLHSPAQYDRPKYNIGGGKRALVFQLMWLGVVFAKLIWESERMNVCFGRNIFLVQERNCRFEIIINVVDVSGSVGSGGANSWHPWHNLQNFSAALSIAGHHTLLLRFCFVPKILKWLSWARATACGLSLFSSTVWVPLK